METLYIIIGIGLMLGIAFLAYRMKDLDKSGENKMLLEYIEALRKDLRQSESTNRQETQTLMKDINDRLAKGLEHSTETLQKQFAQVDQCHTLLFHIYWIAQYLHLEILLS